MQDIRLLGEIDGVDDDEGSSSSTAIVIVTFINQYTKILYHYTHLDLPTFLWNKSHILFYFDSGSLQLRYGVLRTCHSRVITDFFN